MYGKLKRKYKQLQYQKDRLECEVLQCRKNLAARMSRIAHLEQEQDKLLEEVKHLRTENDRYKKERRGIIKACMIYRNKLNVFSTNLENLSSTYEQTCKENGQLMLANQNLGGQLKVFHNMISFGKQSAEQTADGETESAIEDVN